ncbi:MAG: methylmalonyl Co-A mutase-associated GTPase MeaB, partial [Candidatus Dadabacteria bacterium]|nr:methylmalonyl Co-A mutase-associated GTPase MeaB [Candidatus Dadabacteria bacterium]
EGIDKLADEVENHREFQEKTGRLKQKRETRREEEFSEIVKEAVEAAVSEKLTRKEIKKIYDRVKKGEIDPYEGAKLVLSKII